MKAVELTVPWLLQALIHNNQIFIQDEDKRRKLAALHGRCNEAMCRRAGTIQHYCTLFPHILTEAVASILTEAAARKHTLQWGQQYDMGFGSGSFETVSEDGHNLYSIDTLDGTVLINGNPPGLLPNGVIQHRSFLRVFGETNFQVRSLILLYSACKQLLYHPSFSLEQSNPLCSVI